MPNPCSHPPQQKLKALIIQLTEKGLFNFHLFNFTACRLVKCLNLAPAFSFKGHECPAAGQAGSATVGPPGPWMVPQNPAHLLRHIAFGDVPWHASFFTGWP